MALTAWKGLEDELRVDLKHPGAHSGKSLLVIPGAGRVGSYVIQLAKLAERSRGNEYDNQHLFIQKSNEVIRQASFEISNGRVSKQK